MKESLKIGGTCLSQKGNSRNLISVLQWTHMINMLPVVAHFKLPFIFMTKTNFLTPEEKKEFVIR